MVACCKVACVCQIPERPSKVSHRLQVLQWVMRPPVVKDGVVVRGVVEVSEPRPHANHVAYGVAGSYDVMIGAWCSHDRVKGVKAMRVMVLSWLGIG